MQPELETTPAPSPSPRNDRWPSQIKYILGNEAAERFSFYGMRSILTLYITAEVIDGGLAQSADLATTIFHTFIFVNYFMPLLGAWLSDKLIGRYHTILWISMFYCAGHGVLACSDLLSTVDGRMVCLYTGLGLIAFGAGGIKPCVSAFMGDQFRGDQGHLLQKAYAAFYWSINFGSFFSSLFIPYIKDRYGYGWAFGVPGILMAFATAVFILGTKRYVRIPPNRASKTAGFVRVFLTAFRNQSSYSAGPLLSMAALFGLPLTAMAGLTCLAFTHELNPVMRFIGWTSMGAVVLWYAVIVIASLMGKTELKDSFWQAARGRHTESDVAAAKTVSPILFVFALIPLFWALFDQTGSTWVIQGKSMAPLFLFGFKISPEQMQAANPALVMILVPLLTLGLYPRLGRLATPLKRITIGMFLTAASFALVALFQRELDAGVQMNLAWQILPYMVLTTAEVLVSTTGLEFAFTQAAPAMKSTIMSFWLLTVAFGNLIVTGITKLLVSPGSESASVSPSRFLLYSGMMLIVSILFIAVAARYPYRDPAAASGR